MLVIFSRYLICLPQQSNVLHLLDSYLYRYWTQINNSKQEDIILNWIDAMNRFCKDAVCFLPQRITDIIIHIEDSRLLKHFRVKFLKDKRKSLAILNLICIVLSSNTKLAEISFLKELKAITTGNFGNSSFLSTIDIASLVQLCIFDLKILRFCAKVPKFAVEAVFAALLQINTRNVFPSSACYQNALLSTILGFASELNYFMPSLAIRFEDEFVLKPSADNFIQLLSTIIERANFGRFMFIIKSIKGILTMLDAKNTHKGDSYVVIQLNHLLIQLLDRCDTEQCSAIRMEIGKLLEYYLESIGSKSMNTGQLQILVCTIIQRLNDTNENVRSIFFECYTLLDPFQLLMNSDQGITNPLNLEFQVNSNN